jgi:RNA polymerase-binding transcription factor
MAVPDTPDLERFRRLVETELAELVQLQKNTEADRAPVALDQQSVGRLSRMDAMQAQAMAKAAHGRRQVRVVALKRTLVRIEEDDFGFCNDCGEAIAPARLQIDPASFLCVTCAGGRGARNTGAT